MVTLNENLHINSIKFVEAYEYGGVTNIHIFTFIILVRYIQIY